MVNIRDLLNRNTQFDASLTEDELTELEDAHIDIKMEDAGKNVLLKEFFKDPLTTLYTNPEYTFSSVLLLL
ncbi:MAG: hypothetical protein R2741_07305 [Methanolobus sp.]